MKYLLVTPQFGYDEKGRATPGGLLQFGRCLARALASSPDLSSLDIWCQVDSRHKETHIAELAQTYAHPKLDLRVRAFGGRRLSLAGALAESCRRGRFDRVMYTLVNQAVLSELPYHPPFDVWQIGTEFFRRLGYTKRRVMRSALRVFSISRHTTQLAAWYTPGLWEGTVVPLCAEPSDRDLIDNAPYLAGERQAAVLIVGNIHDGLMYKGHQQLIAAWPQVASVCPEAQLWIVGHGDGAPLLWDQVQRLPAHIGSRIHFFGAVSGPELERLYRTARVFAMPSTGEGFGLVFVEAARYGLPCIAGKYDAAREIILHDQTGLLAEQHPHDLALACLRLLTDPAVAERLGEAGRLRYTNYFRFTHFRERLLTSMGLAH
jgi:phosphatidylinositol alpha-1,6-mannosyltransferase